MDTPELERRFEAMAAEAGPRALAVARSLLGSRAAAEDAVQEAFERAYRSLRAFRGEARMETWFMRIVINTAHRHARRHRRFRPVAPDETERQQADDPSPEGSSSATQLRQRLTAAVQTLPQRQQTAFVLRYIEGMSTDETAGVMECALGTVKASLHKAVLKLRRELKDLWAEEKEQ